MFRTLLSDITPENEKTLTVSGWVSKKETHNSQDVIVVRDPSGEHDVNFV